MRRWQLLGTASLAAALLAAHGDAAELLHATVAGDTLWQLCRDYSARADCWTGLQKLNGIGDVHRIPVGSVIRIPADWLREPRIVGGVLESSGPAHYKALAAAEFAPLVVDEPVYLGDEVRTAEGTAVLEFVSGLMVLVRPGSLVLLESSTDDENAPVVNLTLDHGGMEAAMPETAAASEDARPYSVATAAATAGVEGSARLDAGDDGSAMRGEALRGNVQLAGGGSTLSVPEGYGAGIRKGGESVAPRSLLPAPAFLGGDDITTSVQWNAGGEQAAATVAALQAWLEPAGHAESNHPAPDAAQAAGLARQLGADRSAGGPVAPGSIGNSFAPARLAWERGAGASGWHLDVATAPRGRRVLTDFDVADTGIELAALVPGCYVLGLRAVDADGFQGRESRQFLCVHPALGAPGALTAARIKDAAHRLEWGAVVNAVGYAIEVADDAQFTRVTRRERVAGTALELARSRARVEFVRVRAFNVAGLDGPPGEVLRIDNCSCKPALAAAGLIALGVLLL